MAVYLTNTNELTSIADTIRSKCNIETSLEFPSAFCSAINNIQVLSSIQNVSITPTESEQIVTAGINYDGINIVTLYGISSDYLGTNVARNTSSSMTALDNTVVIPIGYYSDNTDKNIENGSMYIPATTINPNLDVAVNSSTGVVTVITEGSQYIAPTINSGYMTSGMAGTISLNGYNTFSLSVQSASTVFPMSVDVTAVTPGVYTISSVMAGTISVEYIGSGISRKTSQVYIPASSNIVILSGQYLTESQTILGDANLVSSNIRKNAQIYGVTGTYENSDYTIFEDAFVMRTLSGTYINSRVSYIGARAFVGTQIESVYFPSCLSTDFGIFSTCSKLQYVDMPVCSLISASAFYSCFSLASVSLPECLSISQSAFFSCTNLSYINLPKVNYIGEYCFYGAGLVSIDAPLCVSFSAGCFNLCENLLYVNASNISTIGVSCFRRCYSLKSVSFPKCTYVYAEAFFECSALSSVYLPSCRGIYPNAFQNCIELFSIDLPECLFIYSSVFSDCTNLTNVNLPKCSSIGTYAFLRCANLESINMSSCSYLGEGAFAGCAKLSSINNASLLSIIRLGTFRGTGLISANFPNVTTIGSYAFSRCYSLETMSLPLCTSLSWYAFADCSSLKIISLPLVSSISGSASTSSPFAGCYNVEEIYMPGLSSMPPIYFSSMTHLKSVDFQGISVISNLTRCYELEHVNIPNAVIISRYAFGYCSALRSINLPAVLRIDSYAFESCINLSVISAPICQSVYEYAFTGCSNLSILSLPSATNIWTTAFRSCGIRELYIPADSDTQLALPSTIEILVHGASIVSSNFCYRKSNLREVYLENCYNFISTATFWSCHNLEKVVLFNGSIASESVATIAGGTFAYCSKLESLAFLPCTTIEYSAFYSCCSLSMIELPNVESIGTAAFQRCSRLASISFPKLLSLDSWAFADCTDLQSIFLGNLSVIQKYAFTRCGLSIVSLENVTNIDSWAFSQCYSISTVSVPNVLTIGMEAFGSCSQLTDIYAPNVISIDAYAFLNCPNLTSVSFPLCISIHNDVFKNCANLFYVSLPLYDRSDWGHPFASCSNLKSVYVPTANITGYDLSWAISTLEILTTGTRYITNFSNYLRLHTVIASNCNTVETNAFCSCSCIATVILASSAISSGLIYYSAFQDCYNLQTFEMSCCSLIMDYAFSGCSNLTTLSFPCLQDVGNYAFCDCINLVSLYLLGSSTASYVRSTAFANTPITDSTLTGSYGSIYVPASLLTDYQTNTYWSIFSDRLVGI